MNKTISSLIEEANRLIESEIVVGTSEFSQWYSKCTYYLEKHYGKDSAEYRHFVGVQYQKRVYNAYEYDRRRTRDSLDGLRVAVTLLESMEDNEPTQEVLKDAPNILNKILIVYGHNDAVRQKVSRILEQQGIVPVALDEKYDVGPTIIEKFEKYSDCNAAICIFSSDDLGKAKEENGLKPRARQNVVFETGFFSGKFGRNKTIILYDESVELPSDLNGIVYININGFEMNLLKSLNTMGFNIDFNTFFKG